MGVVYQASDPQIDRMVAVKVLHQNRTGDENITRRFLKEAMVIGRLSHPNIVSIYDVGEEQGTVYIAMELLEGESLADYIKKNPPDIGIVVAFGIQIGEALDYAHQKGVVHRDIKPANIVVQADGRIKINDFGIAHIDDATATLQTQAGDIMGTPAYMSPEQVLGKPVDGRSDLFSMGALLYELSTGERAFGGDGKGLATVFNDIIHVTPLEPDKALSSVPLELSKIIMKALAKDPEQRFQTGREFADALKSCLKESEPVTTEEQPVEKKKAGYGVIIGVILAIAAIGGGFIYHAQHKETLSAKLVVKPDPQALQPQAGAPQNPDKAQMVKVPSAKEQNTVAPASTGNGLQVDRPLSTEKSTPATKTPITDKAAAKQDSGQKSNAQPSAPVTSRPLPKFAFLKIRTVPEGAEVFVDGTLKGNTPLNLKLGLGTFQVRIARSGYQVIERKVLLEKMKDYPLNEKMIPLK